MDNTIDKLKERHEVALDNLYAIGQYLIMQKDCPRNIRDSWRTLNDYIRNKIDHDS